MKYLILDKYRWCIDPEAPMALKKYIGEIRSNNYVGAEKFIATKNTYKTQNLHELYII